MLFGLSSMALATTIMRFIDRMQPSNMFDDAVIAAAINAKDMASCMYTRTNWPQKRAFVNPKRIIGSNDSDAQAARAALISCAADVATGVANMSMDGLRYLIRYAKGILLISDVGFANGASAMAYIGRVKDGKVVKNALETAVEGAGKTLVEQSRYGVFP
jgi:hypothetical protein